MNILFLMDPIDQIVIEKDTSYVFLKEAFVRGHSCYVLDDGNLAWDQHYVTARVRQAEPTDDPKQPIKVVGETTLTANSIDAVFIRSDPPFDASYLMNTWLLDLLPASIPVINRPGGIRSVNEKIWAMRYPELTPPTYIGYDQERIKALLKDQQHIIIKPTDGFGGQGVFQVRHDDVNRNAIIETMTQHGQQPVIVQPYIPEAKQGDKRILLLNGESVGCVLRVHGQDDHRNNFFAGGSAQPTELTDRDRHVIKTLQKDLVDLGLYFVGIDMLGDYLIEVNVTSPTCVQEINHLTGSKIEGLMLDFLENQ